MTDVDRRGAGSIPAATAAPDRTRAGRARARGRVRDLDSPPIGIAGSSDRAKLEWPKLDPECASDAAVRQLLAALGESLWAQERAIVGGEDAAPVHDLRVAARRARTLLGQLRRVFPRAATKRLRDGLRWLGQISGPVRDLDILIDAVKEAQGKLPIEDCAALEALLLVIARDRAGARQDLLAGLASQRHARLVEAFERFTTPPRRSRRAAANHGRRGRDETEAAPMPIRVIAAESIERAWRRIVRHGQAIDDESSTEALHEVRIDGKKLRYLLELFRSVYPEVELGPVISDLKNLQDCLGVLHDASVEDRMLRALAQRSSAEDGDSTSALVLLGRLIERADGLGAAARRKFPERFAELGSKENRKRIEALAE
jgi:CHAD domain-containing protein